MLSKTKATILFVVWAAALISSARPADAQGIDRWSLLALDRTAFRSRALALMPADGSSGITFAYGDRYGIVHVVRSDARGAQELWRSRVLEGGPVVEVLVEDLDGAGGHDIIVRTQQGRIYVFDELYTPRWESINENYRSVTAMAIANVDGDNAYELVLLADRLINTIDGARFNRETQFTQFQNAQEIAIGNVDTDLDLEIVLNTGAVLDANTGDLEWESESFGQFIELVDIDGDGLLEVIGHNYNQFLRIFDVDEQQEKPLQ